MALRFPHIASGYGVLVEVGGRCFYSVLKKKASAESYRGLRINLLLYQYLKKGYIYPPLGEV
jgi:hypothetical protein